MEKKSVSHMFLIYIYVRYTFGSFSPLCSFVYQSAFLFWSLNKSIPTCIHARPTTLLKSFPTKVYFQALISVLVFVLNLMQIIQLYYSKHALKNELISYRNHVEQLMPSLVKPLT